VLSRTGPRVPSDPQSVESRAGTRGSSTGPAVAVAAGLTPFDIGGDTRGSIQCPATFCGVFGMRPTEHRVPLTGTLFIDPIRKFRVKTTAGPMARSVADLRLAMQVISDPDGHDPEVPPLLRRDTAPVQLTGLRLAYSPNYPSFVAGEIRARTDALATELQQQGVIVEDRLPDPALADHGHLVDELWPMLASAAKSPSPESNEPGSGAQWAYLAALDRRDRFIASWERFFDTCDAFLSPAMPMRAWRLDDGEPPDDSPAGRAAYVALLLSQASGCPMVVIPAGTDTNGVPFGIQLIGRRWHDEQLLAIAEAITAVTAGFRPPPGY
jgi:amidase